MKDQEAELGKYEELVTSDHDGNDRHSCEEDSLDVELTSGKSTYVTAVIFMVCALLYVFGVLIPSRTFLDISFLIFYECAVPPAWGTQREDARGWGRSGRCAVLGILLPAHTHVDAHAVRSI